MPNQYTFTQLQMVSKDGVEFTFKSKKQASRILEFDPDVLEYLIKNNIEIETEIPCNLD